MYLFNLHQKSNILICQVDPLTSLVILSLQLSSPPWFMVRALPVQRAMENVILVPTLTPPPVLISTSVPPG